MLWKDTKIFIFFSCVEFKAVQYEGVTFSATNQDGLSSLGDYNMGQWNFMQYKAGMQKPDAADLQNMKGEGENQVITLILQ